MGMVRFDEIAKECRNTYKGSLVNVPIVGLEHIEPYDMLLHNSDINVETTFTKSFKKGQILFGRRRAYQHKACVATFDGICSGDITVIEPIEGKVYPDLLPFIIQNDDFFEHAIKGSNGALSPRVKWEHMANFELNLPSLAEQKVLAEKLWAAYEVKQSYLKMIEATQEMVKSQFIEMFGTSDANEKGWSISSFGKKLTITSGGTPDTQNESYWNGNISWIGSNLCQNCILKENDGKYITEEGLEHSSAKIYKPDTVLVALVGATIGKVAYLAFETSTNQNVAGIVVNDNKEFEPMFIYYLLQNMYNRFFMLGMGKFKMASLGFIKALPLMMPPLALQKQFVSIAQQADKSVFELRKSIDAIDKVIKSLINENL